MKKEIKIAVAIVLSIWLFVMGFELGIYKERKANMETTNEVVNTVTPTQEPTVITTAPTTAPTTVPTTAPTTTAPATTAPTTAPADVVPVVPQSTTAVANIADSLSEKEIIEKVNAYVTVLKSEKNVKAHKSENIVVNVTDCSVPSAVDIINDIIEGIAGSEEIDYVFTDGKTANGETLFALVPPVNKGFALTDAGVASAKAEKVGTDTVYTIVLVEESTTGDSPVPAHNSTAIGYLDLTSLDLPGVTIKKADMKYPGSTVTITVNAEGKVVALTNYMPMTGFGEAQITFFSGNASFDGYLDEKWTFTY